MDCTPLQEDFIKNIIALAPKHYIEHYQWWLRADWEKYYNDKTDLEFKLDLVKTAPNQEVLCVWASPQTKAYQIYHEGKDLSDLEEVDKEQLLNKHLEELVHCFVGIDLGRDYNNRNQLLELKISMRSFLEMGVAHILEELTAPYYAMLEGWYLMHLHPHWIFHQEGLKGSLFSTFEWEGWHVSSNQNRWCLSCLDYLTTFLEPLDMPSDKDRYLGSITLAKQLGIGITTVLTTLHKRYIYSGRNDYEELNKELKVVSSKLEQLVNWYGHLIIVIPSSVFLKKQTYSLGQVVVEELKGWGTTFEDVYDSINSPSNQIAQWLEDEWFTNRKY